MAYIVGTSGGKSGAATHGTQVAMQRSLNHRSAVTDLHFNPQELLTILSCSDESPNGGGGTVEIWRPHELLMIDVTNGNDKANQAITELTGMLKKK